MGAWALRQLGNALWRQARRIDMAETALIAEEQERQHARQSHAWLEHPRSRKDDESRSFLWQDVRELAKDAQRGMDKTDDKWWQEVREAAADLAAQVPELEPFSTAEANEETLAAWRDAVLSAFVRLERHKAALEEEKEEAHRARQRDIALISYGPRLDAMLRYTAANDRRIRMLLELLERHCEQEDGEQEVDNEAEQDADALEQNEPNSKGPATL
jgi:hypothetical protein